MNTVNRDPSTDLTVRHMQKLSAQILKLSDQLMPYLQDVPTPWGDAGTKAFEAAKVSERRANHTI